MPRHPAILQSIYPYSISARCINREWFQLPMLNVWEIFCEELYLVHKFYNLKIHAFILMNNHFHLIASTPKSNISQCMNYFMKMTSKRLTESSNRINQTYSGRHYKTILDHPNYYLNAYKYIYRNPVEARLSERVENYPYSSLYGLLGQSKLIIPIEEDRDLFPFVESTLEWLNQKPCTTKLDATKWALKRAYFRSKKYRNTNKPIIDINDIM